MSNVNAQPPCKSVCMLAVHCVCIGRRSYIRKYHLCHTGFNSLIDELYDAGLLAVGALEKGLGLSTEERRKASGSSTSSSDAASSPDTSSQRQQPSSSDR